MNLQSKILNTQLNSKEIAIFWLGQAGFLIKDSDGTIVVIDPYLSDCGERIKGFKRISPKLLSPTELAELQPDVYITTHTHFDHFDFDAIPIVSSCSNTYFFGPQSCIDKFKGLQIKENNIAYLKLNKKISYKNMIFEAVYADHGKLAPDAIGMLIEINGIRLYFSGDTAYHPEMLDEIISFKPDIAILSINGKFGNLNSEEGAKLANLINPKVVIPCHFWTFTEHGGDPQLFKDKMKQHAPQCETYIMYQGERLIYSDNTEIY